MKTMQTVARFLLLMGWVQVLLLLPGLVVNRPFAAVADAFVLVDRPSSQHVMKAKKAPATHVTDAIAASMITPKKEQSDLEEPKKTTTSSTVFAHTPRRDWLRSVFVSFLATAASGFMARSPMPANAVGPIKVFLTPKSYSAQQCPKDKPIPGEKAMKGMRPMCVTVKAAVKSDSPVTKDLEKVGVYGFVTDAETGESVLANNPDLSTDAGQFAIVEHVPAGTSQVEFEFIAAIPMEIDTDQFKEGISPLDFKGVRLVSFPGGQQYGAISPCEMNEFSEECEAWEEENGPYERGEFTMKRGNISR